jgi:hypothetical protein
MIVVSHKRKLADCDAKCELKNFWAPSPELMLHCVAPRAKKKIVNGGKKRHLFGA